MSSDREGQGFQAIGSLANKIAHLPASSGSIPSPSETNSGPTGARSLAAKLPNSTGRQLTKTGAESLADAMATNDLIKVNRALIASLPACVSSNLRELERTWCDRDYGFDFRFSGYTFDAAIPSDTLRQALVLVDQACAPAPKRLIQSELARLRVMTKSRSDDTGQLAAAAYAEELAEYPADIVVSALRHWARTEKWWPSWHELHELLERRFEKRRALQEALRKEESRVRWLEVQKQAAE